jgi:radical SAM protein with 4Fe4S-binding SPASM domain
MKANQRCAYLSKVPKVFTDIVFRGRYDFEFDLMPCHTSNMPVAKRLNLFLAGVNLLYRNPKPWNWPLHMQIELTNYCNLRCPVCPAGLGMLRRKPQAIDPVIIERLIKEVGPYLLTLSLWGWGEPLLHPELADILRITQNAGINTFLSTNGQNLNDDKVLQALIDFPPTCLIVCLDGLTDETNSRFRVGAKLEPALYGVHELARMKREKGKEFPILHLRHIVMKHNEHELSELENFARAHYFDILTIRTLSIIDGPDNQHNIMKPDDKRFRAYEYSNDKRVIRDDFICQAAFITPTVYADGTVVSCCQDYNAQQPYGNIADGTSFADIWWSKQAAKIRKTIIENLESFSFCRNCPYKDRPVHTCSIQYYDRKKQTEHGSVTASEESL